MARPRGTNEGGRQLTILSEGIEKLCAAALAGSPPRDFFDALLRASGTPGPRPNVDLARAVGAAIANAGANGDALTKELLARRETYLLRVGLMALAARAARPSDRTRALEALHDLADAPVKETRDAVIDALASVVAAQGDEVLPKLQAMTDGFLHAFVALEAITARPSLDRLKNADEVLLRIGEAFDLADESSRAAERAQGVRLLREGLADQIARVAGRFPETLAWIEERLARTRPETREVMNQTLVALRKRSIGDAESARLRGLFDSHAPKPRDPSRIVKGMRRRGKLRT